MGILTRWLTPAPGKAKARRVSDAERERRRAARDATRRELLTMAVRDTLKHHGIPPDWVWADALNATSTSGPSGIHLRLSLKQWDADLMACLLPLQRAVRDRTFRLDPLSRSWMLGMSWRLDIADDVSCAGMPRPGFWREADEPAKAQPVKPAAAPPPPEDKRRSLDLLFATSEGLFAARANGHEDFSPTQPMLGHGDA